MKLFAALALAATLLLGACTTAQDSTNASPDTADQPRADVDSEQFTVSQENAIGSAESYLDTGSFSETSLIDQLEFEGFSKADARFAVSHVKVDWNEQAAMSAESYLDTGSFSREGLIDQLEFEGFTSRQAIYGVNKTGL